MQKALMAAVFVAALGSTAASALELKSPDIAEGAKISETFVFNGFGCTGQERVPGA